jgi:hypothetical protein
MRWIATSTGSGGIFSAIMRLSSARHCFAAASSWRCLSLANAGAADAVASCVQMAASLSLADAVAGNAKSADTKARSVNKEQRCSLASTVSANVAPHSAVYRQQRSLARVFSTNTAGAPPTLGKIIPWPTLTLPMPQLVPPTHSNAVHWPTPTTLVDSWQHFSMANAISANTTARLTGKGLCCQCHSACSCLKTTLLVGK